MIAEAPMTMAGGGDDLDATVVRRLDELKDAITKRPGPPPWLLPLVIYLITQLVGGVWWAATIQSDMRYLQGENAKLWDQVGVLQLKNEKLEREADDKVRTRVRETLDDWGYLRIRPRKDE